MDAHAALTLTDANFAAEVKDFKGVVLVDFWAGWCQPCLMMVPVMEELAKRYADNHSVKIGKLDVDANTVISQEYSVMSLPTFLVYVNGKDVASVIGAGPISRLEAAIQKALQELEPATTVAA